jgi:hypothetical protein
MNPGDYENALTAASDEIQELLKKRSEIDARINQLKQTVDALAALLTPKISEDVNPWRNAPLSNLAGLMYVPVQDISEIGISDAIRQVIAESKIPLSPVEIKSALASRGVDLSGYANPGTVIHNTLNRLEKQGELMRVQNHAGQTVSYALAYPRTVPPPPGSPGVTLPTQDDIEDGLKRYTRRDKK